MAKRLDPKAPGSRGGKFHITGSGHVKYGERGAAHTVAIYQQTPSGMLRLGLFTTRATSLWQISQAFHRRYPHAHQGGPLFIMQRTKLFGRYSDFGEKLPMDAPE